MARAANSMLRLRILRKLRTNPVGVDEPPPTARHRIPADLRCSMLVSSMPPALALRLGYPPAPLGSPRSGTEAAMQPAAAVAGRVKLVIPWGERLARGGRLRPPPARHRRAVG